jgi:heterodisulfide reductase subunit A-like polyferredoxin
MTVLGLLKALFSLFYGILLWLVTAKPKKTNTKDLRIGVIGGGIAGVGAAWALKRAGAKVTIIEKMPTIGGNAKVFDWKTTPPVTSGLSVLAWPDKYFHNYNQVITQLFALTSSFSLT